MGESSDQFRTQMKQRFVTMALDPQAKQRHPSGPASAKRLGYDAAAIDAVPVQITESFCGVGNPLALGELRPGETVLDVGCGAGLDSLLAARRVGPTGRVVGVDMTEEMVAKAQANAGAAGVGNTAFYHGEADRLPVADESVDVVISNGVVNLCLDKPAVLAELVRILTPGGRVQMADILLDDTVSQHQAERKGLWSD
jgi:SAM-dependent methyltransferase